MYILDDCIFIISVNWFIYIWAVNSGHMIEASLGYYINPLNKYIIRSDCSKGKINCIPIRIIYLG